MLKKVQFDYLFMKATGSEVCGVRVNSLTVSNPDHLVRYHETGALTVDHVVNKSRRMEIGVKQGVIVL